MAQYAILPQSRQSRMKNKWGDTIGMYQVLKVENYISDLTDSFGKPIPNYGQYLVFESKNETFPTGIITAITGNGNIGGVVFNTPEEYQNWLNENVII